MNWYVLDDTVIGIGWGLSPHASFKLKFAVSKTSNSTEFSSECLLEIRPADLLDTLNQNCPYVCCISVPTGSDDIPVLA